jgi:hypothetical protein
VSRRMCGGVPGAAGAEQLSCQCEDRTAQLDNSHCLVLVLEHSSARHDTTKRTAPCAPVRQPPSVSAWPCCCLQASDSAIEAMNGQFLCGRQISVTYAYKKDTKVCVRGREEV